MISGFFLLYLLSVIYSVNVANSQKHEVSDATTRNNCPICPQTDSHCTWPHEMGKFVWLFLEIKEHKNNWLKFLSSYRVLIKYRDQTIIYFPDNSSMLSQLWTQSGRDGWFPQPMKTSRLDTGDGVRSGSSGRFQHKLHKTQPIISQKLSMFDPQSLIHHIKSISVN